jgi:hypothetical protein
MFDTSNGSSKSSGILSQESNVRAHSSAAHHCCLPHWSWSPAHRRRRAVIADCRPPIKEAGSLSKLPLQAAFLVFPSSIFSSVSKHPRHSRHHRRARHGRPRGLSGHALPGLTSPRALPLAHEARRTPCFLLSGPRRSSHRRATAVAQSSPSRPTSGQVPPRLATPTASPRPPERRRPAPSSSPASQRAAAVVPCSPPACCRRRPAAAAISTGRPPKQVTHVLLSPPQGSDPLAGAALAAGEAQQSRARALPCLRLYDRRAPRGSCDLNYL